MCAGPTPAPQLHACRILVWASLPSLFWRTGCNQAAGDAAGNLAPALAATIECKVATQSCHVTRWPQIGAVNLHSGSDWPVVFRIKLTNGTHPLDPWLDFWGFLFTF